MATLHKGDNDAIIIIIIIHSSAFSVFNSYDLSVGVENATKLSIAEKPPS
jgi:surface polysaccharide O-acyltransferase-like enzyme